MIVLIIIHLEVAPQAAAPCFVSFLLGYISIIFILVLVLEKLIENTKMKSQKLKFKNVIRLDVIFI